MEHAVQPGCVAAEAPVTFKQNTKDIWKLKL